MKTYAILMNLSNDSKKYLGSLAVASAAYIKDMMFNRDKWVDVGYNYSYASAEYAVQDMIYQNPESIYIIVDQETITFNQITPEGTYKLLPRKNDYTIFTCQNYLGNSEYLVVI